ncbi:MAG TPA: hypothetical protein VD790_10605 [Thermoleophilaceae bacterium]|nr:hypothetical protein [Thermoleophilaceae bacterium]
MTPQRYVAYRHVRTVIERLRPEALADAEKALLCDAAEGLLLARHADTGTVEELRAKVAVSLSVLVGLGRWDDAAADELWEQLVACGPSDGRTARLPRAVEHA